MQQGSIIHAERRSGPDVWEFRWREPGPDGKRKHRARLKGKPLTISELAEHYRQRELKPDTVWKTYSTKLTYEGYLSKWILPRWEITSLRASTLEKLNCGCDPCLLLDLAAPRPEIS